MPLSDIEKKKVLMHLGYTVLATPTQLSLGSPQITQARFVVDQNMQYLDASGEPLVRAAIARLDCIDAQRDQLRGGLEVEAADGVRFRGPDGLMELERQYNLWQERLADLLAAQVNPVSNQAVRRFGGVQVIEPC